jgi:hypothetical protein
MGLSGYALRLAAEMPGSPRPRLPDLKNRLAENCNRLAESGNIT